MRAVFAGSFLSALLLTAASAQNAATPPARSERPPRPLASAYPGPKIYPEENHQLVAKYLYQAVKLAGQDELFQDMAHRCIISPVFPVRVRGIQYNGKIIPTKLFDNLYAVGQNEVSSQALVTSDGIILFDTLNSEDEAKNLLVPNLKAVGLDPKDIKYIVITHEHGDHYGGARYLQETYHAKVVASEVAWEGMKKAFEGKGFGAGLPIPDKDIAITKDGQSITLGNTTLKFYLTPGHTPGTMSTYFPVTDNGVKHMVGYFGGTGGGRTVDSERDQIASLERWEKISSAAGVDVNITNHPLHDEGLEKEYILRYRVPGEANPFVLGKQRYQRYLQIQAVCAKVMIARFGVDADAK